ncbi:MAG TPA: serine hydrolase domain-containing protein [Chthoniobacterales bacterium]|nr:serine hydrolase domain-containing protein [Chthoniobacterales bacterium]
MEFAFWTPVHSAIRIPQSAIDLLVHIGRLTDLFAENFIQYQELGASVCIIERGEQTLNIGNGFIDRTQTTRWTPQTRVLIWSATKALASACLLHCCEQAGIALDRRVKDFWPEYSANGKEDTKLSHILAHESGQPAVRQASIGILDHEAVVQALAEQEPFWRPGRAHGYHPRTYGFLVDELVRRISSGTTVADYFRKTFGQPLELDLWIGIPSDLANDVAPIQTPRQKRESSSEDPFYQALADQTSLTYLAFSTPSGPIAPSAFNSPELRMHPLPSLGGIGTAESLARFYYRVFCEPEFLSRELLSMLRKSIVSGHDQVLQIPTAFGLGFMKDPVSPGHKKLRRIFGPSEAAFGQPGAGGSHAFVDPDRKLAFAYVMNQMEPGVLPNPKSLRLVDQLYAESV